MFKLITRLLLRPKPKNVGEGEINYIDLIDFYRKAFGMDWLTYIIALLTGKFKLENEYYKEISDEDEKLIEMILDADQGDKEEWILDWYDCGAFTFRLMGVFHADRDTAAMPILILWVSMPEGGHAIITYKKGDEAKIIEPQNDDIYGLPSGWGLELLCG